MSSKGSSPRVSLARVPVKMSPASRRKDELLFRPNLVDEGCQLGDAADVLEIVAPECGDRVVGALEIVGVEQGDFLKIVERRGLDSRLCAAAERDDHNQEEADTEVTSFVHAKSYDGVLRKGRPCTTKGSPGSDEGVIDAGRTRHRNCFV